MLECQEPLLEEPLLEEPPLEWGAEPLLEEPPPEWGAEPPSQEPPPQCEKPPPQEPLPEWSSAPGIGVVCIRLGRVGRPLTKRPHSVAASLSGGLTQWRPHSVAASFSDGLGGLLQRRPRWPHSEAASVDHEASFSGGLTRGAPYEQGNAASRECSDHCADEQGNAASDRCVPYDAAPVVHRMSTRMQLVTNTARLRAHEPITSLSVEPIPSFLSVACRTRGQELTQVLAGSIQPQP